ncbi:MAG: YiiX/YebB-like N1pC/P60 family cysteine hydrolase [Litorimonas sp.]
MTSQPNSKALSTLLAAHAGLPTPSDMDTLIRDSQAAEARGYYNPVEDERLRETYTRYLAIRSALWEVIQSLPNPAKRVQRDPASATPEDWRGFSIAFCAAELIVRTGEYLIDLARDRGIVWKKLDEADQRYSLERKSFTRLYRQLTSAFRMRGFYRACDVYDAHRDKVMSAAPAEITDILKALNLPTASRGDHLRRYHGFVRHSVKRRNLSAWKNILFSIFEMMGSDIADLKIPFVKPLRAPKRVTPEIISAIQENLQPGDVFVTRHDDAMSNVFLPGFWPHSALWLGAADADILEAKKDGVLLRQMEETLQVDAFTVIRPKLSTSEIGEALERARSHAGKQYDFVFDFRTTDRLVCTEVIYRTYHGMGPIDFNLVQQAGRHCLSAEELLNQGIGQDWFDVVATFGVGGNDLILGEAAKDRLRGSFESRF